MKISKYFAATVFEYYKHTLRFFSLMIYVLIFRCNKRTRLYTCPRCGIGYCGVECYKSDVHIDCSESFYKQCVEDELKSQENDPAIRQKMMEILKRVHAEDVEYDILGNNINEENSPLDSDDELEVNKTKFLKNYTLFIVYQVHMFIFRYNFQLPDLEVRLQNVNLDNPNELWSALSNTERHEFEALLKNGEAEKLLPKWTPWWTYHKEKKLIQPIEEDATDDYSSVKYPVLIDVPLFNELQVK